MSKTTTQPRCITKAVPGDPTAKWFHDNVHEYLRKALRVFITNESIDVNVLNDIGTSDSLESGVDGIMTLTAASAVQEIKIGATPYLDRNLIYVQPLNGNVWWGTDPSVGPNNGIKLFKYQVIWIPASDSMPIYIARDNKDVNVAIIEAK